MFRPASAAVLSPKVGCASNGFGFKTPPPLMVSPDGGLAGPQPVGPGAFTGPAITREGGGMTREPYWDPTRGMRGLQGRRLGQDTLLRFEVKDAMLGNFVPNASVSLVYQDGTHVLTKLTDAGGNVAFGEGELREAAEQAGLRGAEGVVWYTVEAPGYQMAEGMAWDPDIPAAEQLKKIYEIALKPAAPSAKTDPAVVAGVTAAALLAIGLL